MTMYKDKYRVESTRLPGWDYASTGYYFVTICTYERACFLGEIRDGAMALSSQGMVVDEEWRRTESVRKNVILDEWVIMPNHIHGVIVLKEISTVETHRWRVSNQPDQNLETPQWGVSTGLKPGSLGSIINQFKSLCTKRIRAARLDFAWQTRYHEHIIRDDRSLNEIRLYIRQNPMRWDIDKNNPKNV